MEMKVVAKRGKEPSGDSRKQLDLHCRLKLEYAFENRVCPGGVAEAVGGNEDTDRRPGTDTSGIQAANLDVSATEVLIQKTFEVLLVILLHLLCPLQ